jgi:hypothetical protein
MKKAGFPLNELNTLQSERNPAMNASRRGGAWRQGGSDSIHARQMRHSLRWLLRQSSVQSLPRHGNTSWQPAELISLALFWVWSAAPQLTEAFVEAREHAHGLFGRAAVTTYQGLVGALQTWTATLVPLLQQRIQALAEQFGGVHFRVGRWCAIAIDGSRCSAPRTRSNERAFCAPNYGHGQTAKYRRKKTRGMRRRKNERSPAQPQGPQLWTTMMWHIGLGLPWCWKLGPSNSSEREHVRELLAAGQFPRNTLFIGDAGFVGYDLWNSIRADHRHFLVRVGKNVSLLRKLDLQISRRHADRVWCWPLTMQRRERPLELRLVNVPLGRGNIWLLTSVLDERQLTTKDMRRLYQLRWGVEVQFRGLKQTFARCRLRSRAGQRAVNELEWSLLGLTLVQLFALQQQLAADADPRRLSLAGALRAIRRSLRRLDHRSSPMIPWPLLLRSAVLDNYQRRRPKRARYRPISDRVPRCGQPRVRTANAHHRRLLKLPKLQLRAA